MYVRAANMFKMAKNWSGKIWLELNSGHLELQGVCGV